MQVIIDILLTYRQASGSVCLSQALNLFYLRETSKLNTTDPYFFIIGEESIYYPINSLLTSHAISVPYKTFVKCTVFY